MPKNKVKLNDKTDNRKSQKKKTIKEEKYMSDESREVRNFVIILLSVIVIVLIVYGVSKVFIDDEPASTEKNVQKGVIDYDKVSVGTMLNRNYSEYYVAIYDEEAPESVVYSAIITKYLDNEDCFLELNNQYKDVPLDVRSKTKNLFCYYLKDTEVKGV